MSRKRPKFKSEFEKKAFKALQKYGKVTYEGERLGYVVNRNYLPDFVVEFQRPEAPDTTSRIYIETKGYFSPADRAKMLAVKKAHPEKDIRLIFLANNKLHKGTETRYADWAEKNGFPFAIFSIPKEWFR